MSSSNHGGGAREQRALSFAFTDSFLATWIRLELVAVKCRHRLWAACGAPGPTPGQHGTPQGPERLRCTAPLTALLPCNNISAHRQSTTNGTHELRALFTIKFTDCSFYMLYYMTSLFQYGLYLKQVNTWTRLCKECDWGERRGMRTQCPSCFIIIVQTTVSVPHAYHYDIRT